MKKPRDLRMYIRDILESCDQLVKYIGAKDIDAFRKDIQAQDAAIRRFQIIGEAVKRIPNEFRQQFPNVMWGDAAGFCDVLVHDYPEVIVDEVYFTAKNQLPEFREQIRQILESLK